MVSRTIFECCVILDFVLQYRGMNHKLLQTCNYSQVVFFILLRKSSALEHQEYALPEFINFTSLIVKAGYGFDYCLRSTQVERIYTLMNSFV